MGAIRYVFRMCAAGNSATNGCGELVSDFSVYMTEETIMRHLVMIYAKQIPETLVTLDYRNL